MSFREPYMGKLVCKIGGSAKPPCHYPGPVGTAVSSRGGKSFMSLFQSPSLGEAAPSGSAPLRAAHRARGSHFVLLELHEGGKGRGGGRAAV